MKAEDEIMDMKKIAMEEAWNIPPMSEEEKREIENHTDTDFSDCPVITAEQLEKAKRGYEIHPEWYET